MCCGTAADRRASETAWEVRRDTSPACPPNNAFIELHLQRHVGVVGFRPSSRRASVDAVHQGSCQMAMMCSFMAVQLLLQLDRHRRDCLYCYSAPGRRRRHVHIDSAIEQTSFFTGQLFIMATMIE